MRGFFKLTAKDAGIAGNIVIAGLPVTVKSGTSQDEAGSVSIWSNWSIGTGYTHIGIQAEQGQSRIRLYRSGAAVASGLVASSHMAATSELSFSCEYEAA